MPNHVTNVIECTPEVAKSLLKKWTDEELAQQRADTAEANARYKERTGKDWPYPEPEQSDSYVEFGILIPEPDDMFRGGCNMQHPHPKPESEGGGYYAHCWYNWNVENWGTKWGAYSTSYKMIEDDRIQIRFDTAWSPPFPIIDALIRKHVDEKIEIWFADEDLGSNYGHLFSDGQGNIVDLLPWDGADDQGSVRATIFAALICERSEETAKEILENYYEDPTLPAASKLFTEGLRSYWKSWEGENHDFAEMCTDKEVVQRFVETPVGS